MESLNDLRVEYFDLLLQKHCLLLVIRIESRILNMASHDLVLTSKPLLTHFSPCSLNSRHTGLRTSTVAGFFLLQGLNTGCSLKNLSLVFLTHPSKCLSKVTPVRKNVLSHVTGQISLSHALSSHCICFFLSLPRTVINH